MTNKSTFYASMVALGGFLFGFDASVISGVVRFVSIEWELTAWQQGWVVGAPTLAAIFSALLVGPLADRFGRKTVMIALAIIYLLSAILSTLAQDYMSLVLARGLGGLAFGSLGLAPMYIAEISPAKRRGFMVSFNQMNIVIGFAVSYFSNYLLLNLSTGGSEIATTLAIDTQVWRWMLGMELLPAALFFIGASIIPESPRWLVRANKLDQARSVSKKLFPNSDAAKMIDQIKETVKDCDVSVKEQFSEAISKRLRLPIMIGIVVGIAQQVTGINAIYFYAPNIFEQTGVGTNAAFAQAALLGVTNVVFTVIAMLLIDRLGRKPLLLAGLVGVFISMSVAAYGFSQASYTLTPQAVTASELSESQARNVKDLLDQTFNSDTEFKDALKSRLGNAEAQKLESAILANSTSISAWLILAAIVGFTASFAISLGPVMWCLFAEIFPNRVRGMCNAIVGIFNSMASFFVQLVFPWELETFGAATTFLIFGLLSIISFTLIALLLPETKGKSLEELETLMGTKRN